MEEGLAVNLAVSLLTTKTTDVWSKSYQSVLVYFTGILSLNLTDGSPQNPHFNPVADSTSILSGLIWVSRVLLLEYALPQKPCYSQDWPDRSTYPDPLDRLCTIHTAYMTHESLTPLSELLRLRRIGRDRAPVSPIYSVNGFFLYGKIKVCGPCGTPSHLQCKWVFLG